MQMPDPIELHYSLEGDGPPLLLGSSLGTTLAMWEPQVQGLTDAHRLIRFDARGHGQSPIPPGPYSIADLGGDVLALMDRLELERAAYCGISIGGMVGQWLAVHAPDRIERLVVICSSPRISNADMFLARAATVQAAGSVEPLADAVITRWFTPQFTRANPEIVARHRAMLADTPAEGYAACCAAVAGHDVLADLPGVSAPTLVISGAQDEAIPPQHGRAIAEAIPGAGFELLDPAAHLASVERGDIVNALIDEHLR